FLVGPSNNGATTLDATYPITLADRDGWHAYYLIAHDAAGNATNTQAHTTQVRLDRVAPTVTNAGYPSDFNAAGWCKSPCRVTVLATDDDDLQVNSVTVNGGAVTPSANAVDLASLGAQGSGVSVTVSAKDRATNATSATRSYKVDVTSPTVVVNAASTWQR